MIQGLRNINPTNNEIRVYIAGARLTGAAKDWFEPRLRDYERNGQAERKQLTRNVFLSLGNRKYFQFAFV